MISIAALAAIVSAALSDGESQMPHPTPVWVPVWAGFRLLHPDGRVTMHVVRVEVDANIGPMDRFVYRAGLPLGGGAKYILTDEIIENWPVDEIFTYALSRLLGVPHADIEIWKPTSELVHVVKVSYNESEPFGGLFIQPLFVIEGKNTWPVYFTHRPHENGDTDPVFLTEVPQEHRFEQMIGELDIKRILYYTLDSAPGVPILCTSVEHEIYPMNRGISDHVPMSREFIQDLRDYVWGEDYYSDRRYPFAIFVSTEQEWPGSLMQISRDGSVPLQVEVDP